MKLKVMILCPYLSGRGGMETVLATLMNDYPQDADLELSYCLTQGFEYPASFQRLLTTKTVQVAQGARLKFMRNTLGIFKVIADLKRIKPQIVVCMSSRLITLAQALKPYLHQAYQVVSWLHFSLVDHPYIKAQTVQRAEAHLCISAGIQQQLLALHIPKAQTQVIYNPVATNWALLPRSKGNVKQFVYVGRLLWQGQKNLQVLCHSLVALKGAWHLTFVGIGPDQAQLKAFCDHHGLRSQVTFTGWQKEPWAVLQQADCLVLTSAYEGLPMTLLEAMSHGVPVISSDCPTGPGELVTKANGRLYEPDKPIELTRYLQQVIDGELVFEPTQVQASVARFEQAHFFQAFQQALQQIARF